MIMGDAISSFPRLGNYGGR